MKIKVKRIYEKATRQDGLRVLVDRLWPRGVSKKEAAIQHWFKEIAPSDKLRRWFNHDPEKWEEFRSRYFSELNKKSDLVKELLNYSKASTLTLVFGTKEQIYNNANALKEYLEKV